MKPAYQLDEVMLPHGSVYHLQLVDAHPEVWPDLPSYLWTRRQVPLDNLPASFCSYGDRDGVIPHRGGRRLCVVCEEGAAELEYRVDLLRLERLGQLARHDPGITGYLRAKVGW